MAWEIEYFEHEGKCPSREFILAPEQKAARPVIVKAIDQLEEFGNTLRRPQADYLEDGIYELRIRWMKIQYRFLYFFDGKKIIVVTQAFRKTGNAVPKREIQKAKEYRNIYYSRKK